MTLSIACAVGAALMAFVYLLRSIDLEFAVHRISLVLSNLLSGAACVYSSYSLLHFGLGVLELGVPVLTLVYLIRSHDTYMVAKDRNPGRGRRAHDNVFSKSFHGKT